MTSHSRRGPKARGLHVRSAAWCEGGESLFADRGRQRDVAQLAGVVLAVAQAPAEEVAECLGLGGVASSRGRAGPN